MRLFRWAAWELRRLFRRAPEYSQTAQVNEDEWHHLREADAATPCCPPAAPPFRGRADIDAAAPPQPKDSP